MHSFSSLIETCWPIIEAYSDLEASIAMAQTCRSIHRATIDADSNKLKVSHFEVDNSPTSYPNAIPAKNWHTAPARIPHYLSRSLDSIHFPSLRRLSLDFPATRRRNASGHADFIDDACASALPIFATNLGHARNLVRLRLDAGRLVAGERSGRSEASYEVFARNLARCGALRDLEVRNSGVARGNPFPVYSVALLRALIPAIRKGGIERLKVVVAGHPSDPLYERLLVSNGVDSAFDLFEAALRAGGLSALELSASESDSHVNALVAASTVDGATKPSRLTKLRLNCERGTEHFRGDLLSAAPLLRHFSGCRSLESVFLSLPAQCWEGEETARALRQLLEDKPRLSSLTVSFSCFSGGGGGAMRAVAGGLANNIGSKTLRKLSIFGLVGADEEDTSRLQRSLRASGMICDKFSVINRRGGKWDVLSMNNREAVEGEAVTDKYKERMKHI